MATIEITQETLIGDVVRDLPGGEDVIRKYFGNGCFTCPGMGMESISFGAMMHGLEPEPILRDLQELTTN
ncbi:DUF1858 domain-containing protein [Chloroflexota bacterium]